jgi:hypothetical protein
MSFYVRRSFGGFYCRSQFSFCDVLNRNWSHSRSIRHAGAKETVLSPLSIGLHLAVGCAVLIVVFLLIQRSIV